MTYTNSHHHKRHPLVRRGTHPHHLLLTNLTRQTRHGTIPHRFLNIWIRRVQYARESAMQLSREGAQSRGGGSGNVSDRGRFSDAAPPGPIVRVIDV